jgi:hypothetical protein
VTTLRAAPHFFMIRLRSFSAAALSRQHLAFMVDGAPKIAEFAVDLHKHLIQVPAPLRIGARATRLLRISAAKIGPNRFHQNRTVSWLISMPTLGQQTLDVAQRRRISHVHHHDQTDDLRRAIEIAERVAHRLKLPRRDAAGFLSDSTPKVLDGSISRAEHMDRH